jgi:opacity protein-like surface antigen
VSFPNLSGLNGLNGSYQMKNPYNFSVIPGYELSMNQVLYGKVAYTVATVVYSDSVIPATEVKMSGYTIGLGYKQALDKQLYFFAEGLYTKFEDKTASTNGSYSGGLVNSSLTAGASGFTALVGAGYRF